MYQVMKRHYKDLATLALLAILGWYGYTTINGLRAWKQNITLTNNVSIQYMQRDNPAVLKAIINPEAKDEKTQVPRQKAGNNSPAGGDETATGTN